MLALATATAGAATQAAPALTIYASHKRIALAGYEIRGRGQPTYAGAIRAFGAPDSCHLAHTADGQPLPNFADTTWTKLGLHMTFGSYGAFARGGDACSEPEHAYLSHATITSPDWRTARGLRIGDTTTRPRHLYPDALPHNGSWWLLVEYSAIGSGGLYPVLYATARPNGHINTIQLQIDAEGE